MRLLMHYCILCAYNIFNILNVFMRPFMHYLYLCGYICIFPKYEIRVSHLYLPFPHRSATVHFLCSTNCILTPLGSSTKMNFVNGLGCIGPALISTSFAFRSIIISSREGTSNPIEYTRWIRRPFTRHNQSKQRDLTVAHNNRFHFPIRDSVFIH